MDNYGCDVKSTMKQSYSLMRSFVLPMLAVFIALLICQHVMHHVVLMPYYKATSSLWRPTSDIQDMVTFFLVQQVIIAGMVTGLYGWLRRLSVAAGLKGCPMQMSMRFGLKIGLLLGTLQFGSFIFMPIPLEIAACWFIGGLLEGIIISIVLAMTYGTKKTAEKA